MTDEVGTGANSREHVIGGKRDRDEMFLEYAEITPDGRLIPFCADNCADNCVGYCEQVREQMSGTETDRTEIKACCAASYGHDAVALVLGASYHPGGLALWCGAWRWPNGPSLTD